MNIGDPDGEMVVYVGSDGRPTVDVKFQGETAWLTQAQIVELFQSSKSNISEHISNIFKEGELQEKSVVREFRTTASDDKTYITKYYNLDMIISIGYRVKSQVATRFRIWATERLREYIIKGFTIDSDRLKGDGGGDYWKDLLNEIRDIRSSEKVMFRQVLDLYATAIDYDSATDESREFFKILQNKVHFAAHGNTASEVIYLRVDSDKPFAGLMNFKGSQPTQAESMIAKNYLTLDELKVLNNLVSAYFDIAEINAIEHIPMHMADYIRELDNVLGSTSRKVLRGKGSVTHDQAITKAKQEFRKYKAKTLSDVERAYLDELKNTQKKLK
ncbi:cell filamentation protein Fic [Candidatus Saccharibacteria bacterium]|nr:cell filamentation protein Fic [Candidatus Saccharibacteria bacterium]